MMENPRLRLLVYDPHPEIRDALRRLQREHDVTIVHSVQEAEDHIRQNASALNAVVSHFQSGKTGPRHASKSVLAVAEEFGVPTVALAETEGDLPQGKRHADAAVSKLVATPRVTEAILRAIQSRKPHVLIIDEENIVGRTFERQLREHNPILFLNPEDALGHVRRHHPRMTAAIVDLFHSSKGMNDNLMALLADHKIPFIVTAASLSDAQRALAGEFDPENIVQKPLEVDLNDRVKNIKRRIG